MSISSKLPLSTQLELDDTTSVPQESIFDTPAYKESSFKTSEVEESARNSLDFLAALALPTVFKYLFPPVFQAIWTWLLSYVHKSRDFSQLAIGLPRGFGKTMLTKIFSPIPNATRKLIP